MPLLQGGSDEVRDENIRELIDSGHAEDQAVAIAYKVGQKGAKGKTLKRPTLHPKHPFNNAKAPDNKRKMPMAPVVPAVKAPVVPGSKLPVVSGGHFTTTKV